MKKEDFFFWKLNSKVLLTAKGSKKPSVRYSTVQYSKVPASVIVVVITWIFHHTIVILLVIVTINIFVG